MERLVRNSYVQALSYLLFLNHRSILQWVKILLRPIPIPASYLVTTFLLHSLRPSIALVSSYCC